jgi:hypothetical protein
VRAVLLGLVLGALVVLDPFATAYLLRDFSPLRDLPYLLSLTAALTLGMVYAVRPFVPGLAATVIHDYWRYFPLLFLLAYQFAGVAVGPLDPTEIVIGVFMLLFLAGLFMRRDEQFVSTPFNMLQLALAICIVLSLVSEFRVLAFLKSFKPFVVFFLLVNFLPRQNVILPFLRWLLVLAFLSGIFCFVQEVAWLAYRETLSLIREADLKRSFETYFGVPIFRTPSLMPSYRLLAMYEATALSLAVSALLWRTDKPLLPRGWLWAGVFVFAAAIGLAIAKPVMLGLVLGIGLLLILHRPSRVVPAALAGLAGIVALLVAIAVVPGNIDTAFQIADEIPKAEQERIRLDRDGIEGVLHSPYTWLGRGVAASSRYTAHVLGWAPHNYFIQVTAELGVVGLIVYLLIYARIWALAVALNIKVKDGPYLPVVRGLLATLVVQLVQAQFEGGYLDNFVWTIFATIEAIWFRLGRQALATAASPTPARDTA